MNTPNRELANLRLNPNWAKLPLFERKGWKRFRFDQIAESIRESVMPTPEDSATYIGLEHMDSGCLQVHRWGSHADLIGQKLQMRKGDILFARRNAYLRRVAIAPHDGLFSAHGMILRAKPEVVLSELLPFLMLSDRFMSRAETISVGSLSPTINWTTLKLEEFDLPPLAQQRRIADILWAIDKAMEAWFELKSESKAATATYAISVFHGTAVAEAGANGVTRRLGDIFEVRTGGTPSRAQPDYWDGQIPWIKTGEVNYADIYDSKEKISALGYEHSAVKMIPPDSVLMAMYGQGPTLGRVAQLRVEATVNQACAAIFPTSKFNMRYLYYYLVHQYSNIRKLARGASQPNINALIVKDFIVPAPALEEQSAVVDTFEGLDRAQCEIDIHLADTKKLLFDLINGIRA